MGVFLAILIILAWIVHLGYSFTMIQPDLFNPWMYVHLLVQTYFFTGLFITGHDAIHGTVSRNRFVNQSIGYVSVFLYAGMWYPSLIRNHALHHMHPGTEEDPDYSMGSQNFFVWWFRFMMHYITWIQLVIMAIIFNIFGIWFSDWSIITFWVVPALLSTFQLFYFGTYVPHKRPHTSQMGVHKARTQKRFHAWALLSCYFFGYHREHHESPRTPWWKLYQLKS